jgi:hypothetical protein
MTELNLARHTRILQGKYQVVCAQLDRVSRENERLSRENAQMISELRRLRHLEDALRQYEKTRDPDDYADLIAALGGGLETGGDRDKARDLADSRGDRLYRIATRHAIDDTGHCHSCSKVWPCATWRDATGAES